ncbi:hypothetical protein O181_077015 [Austropuccinia psidii MF-1]|uniref:Uncharacterized protein n=1 Tax=Austropuccinia psidii MF-1 TaxID=1389203 RepID=A0A9Q3F9X6_9BASI|nr:hypothetical protein [Austropuccinia psidii MF-1]
MLTEIGIPIPYEESSDDEIHLKTKMTVLDQTNWVQWSCQMENYLTARQYDDLLIPPTEETKHTSKFKQKNSSGLSLLWGCVSKELEGILLDNRTSFYDMWEALGKVRGKNSIVVICESFRELMTLRYNPETSLKDHICKFQKILARHNSITTDKELGMSVSPTMAAAAFLSSLNGDRYLTGLIQTLYDPRPFTMSTVVNRVSIEHSQQQQSNDQALFVGNSSNKYQQKPRQNELKTKGKNQRNVKKFDRSTRNQYDQSKTDSDKRLESLEKMISRLQETINNQSVHLATEDNNAQINSDSNTFMIKEKDGILSTDESKIYLDSGAGKSVVNDLSLLTNVVKVNHQIDAYGSSVQISHQGTLNFKTISINPVYYAPNGPVTLLSVSQLLDNDIKPVVKNKTFLPKKGDTIVATFKREGKLFTSKISLSQTFITTDRKDWHTLLGHPSDSYINHLIKKKEN